MALDPQTLSNSEICQALVVDAADWKVIARKRLFAPSFVAPIVTCFDNTTMTSCLCQVPGYQQRVQCCSRASLHAARRRNPSKSAGPKLARRRAQRAAVRAQGIAKPGHPQRKTRAARNMSNKIRLAEAEAKILELIGHKHRHRN